MSGGRIRSVRFKDGYTADSLGAAFASVGNASPYSFGPIGTLPGIFTHQLAIAAYMASGMLKKVISIPAEDRVREWRDWQADAKAIEKIEAEEKRLQLIAKVQEAELLRGIGGGALIIITTGAHDQELKPEQIGANGIVAINVVSRWQITGKGWIKDLASPLYGQPEMWEVDSGNGQRARIHPSRVIPFRGARLPAGSSVTDEDAYWGDSRLLRVYGEVDRADKAQAWFAELVKKAKLLRFGVPGLEGYDQDQLNKRVGLIAQGESLLNATLFRASGGTDDPGETITDYQVNWNGIPAMMDAFDQRVAAVSDIPFTRLMGRSPAGMNATGAYDDLNLVKTVRTGQELELRPCLEQLDPLLLRSAGVEPEGVWWQFAPLSSPTEKEAADTFAVIMGAVEKLQNTGTIPEREFAKGLQNLAIENGWLPGIDEDLSKLSDDERYGLNPDDDGSDPSSLQAEKGGDPSTGARGNLPATRQNGRF